MKSTTLKIIKRNGNKQDFDPEKIKVAIRKSAERVMICLTEEAENEVVRLVLKYLQTQTTDLEVRQIHNCVEAALEHVNPLVAKSYREYRNYKKDFVHILDKVYQKAQEINYIGNKESTNVDSELVTTQRNLVYSSLNQELYKKFFLTTGEITACEDGYIYIHDMDARRDTIDSCLCDMQAILKDGFEMNNLWYTEPKTIETAFDVLGDVIVHLSSMQYGDLTVPEIDSLLLDYAKKSLELYKNDYLMIKGVLQDSLAEEYALKKLKRACEQGYQGITYKLNTMGNICGKRTLVTFTFGIESDEIGQLITKTILQTHAKGQGKVGFKRTMIFPRLVFLYDKQLHGKGCSLEKSFIEALACSAKAMYPDYLSLSGKGYVSQIYQKYHLVVSPVGRQTFLLPYFEDGGLQKAGKEDYPVFVGRFHIGTVSLNLPMIFAKAKEEQKNFYEILDYYLEMIRKIHLRTYEYLGKRKASTNPLAYCEGGFYKGQLKAEESIAPLLKSATASFGVTALNELQYFYNQKSLVEDSDFAIEVMEHIEQKIQEFRDADQRLYAVCAGEDITLGGLQVKQFRDKYGIVDGVSNREYFSDSFHCGVWEDINGVLKQDLEERFWKFFQGGGIQCVRFDINYNMDAMRTIIERAMDKGFLEGINLDLAFCDECGYAGINMDVCPKCGSLDLIKISRVNGALAYSRIHGNTKLPHSKMVEISERKSM